MTRFLACLAFGTLLKTAYDMRHPEPILDLLRRDRFGLLAVKLLGGNAAVVLSLWGLSVAASVAIRHGA